MSTGKRRRLKPGESPSPAALRRQKHLETAYREAAADPLYQREMAELALAFDSTIGDGLKEEK